MLYVDESIQQSLGYLCVGFAYCEVPPDDLVNDAIRRAGLTPGLDEYKSGARMAGNSVLRALRDDIAGIVLGQCKLGVYIAPTEERPVLLSAIASTANSVVERNKLPSRQAVYVDSGILGNASAEENELISLACGCDSRTVPGIQLADYVAYHCSYLMKCAMEGTSKSVRVDIKNYPVDGEDVELDWLTRTQLRRNFFVEPRNVDEINGDDWFFNVAGYGAFFSSGLSAMLRNAAQRTFESMYFGCVW